VIVAPLIVATMIMTIRMVMRCRSGNMAMSGGTFGDGRRGNRGLWRLRVVMAGGPGAFKRFGRQNERRCADHLHQRDGNTAHNPHHDGGEDNGSEHGENLIPCPHRLSNRIISGKRDTAI
jgi:hypothetical protein